MFLEICSAQKILILCHANELSRACDITPWAYGIIKKMPEHPRH